MTSQRRFSISKLRLHAVAQKIAARHSDTRRSCPVSRTDRSLVIERFLAGEIDIGSAASLLGVTLAELHNIQTLYRNLAPWASVTPHTVRGPGYRYPSCIRDSVIHLAGTVYAGLSPTEIKRHIEARHNLSLRVHTIRNWLIRAQLWTAHPRARRVCPMSEVSVLV